MKKSFIATLATVLFAFTILSASANPVYVAADSFDRASAVSNGWGTSQNSVSATNYAWAGDLATDPGAAAVGGYGLLLCRPCTTTQAFSGTLGPSHAGGTVSATFENLTPTQQISVALDSTTDLSTAYLARVNYNSGYLEIVKRVSSSETILSSVALPCYKHTFITVSLTVSGSALSASAQYTGGSAVTTSVTDNGTLITCGKAGFYYYVGALQFSDNVLVDSFSATTAAA